ncbi:MAG: bifunctional metallophosphatase/5'-nucleotidase [Bacteroidales bacterium]|nr:bifunctional metallophosphatase/5'-nucleotidase [Bacteroidales bacterium]
MAKKLLALILLAVASSIFFYTLNKKSNLKIRIIETTDVHGSIYPYDFIQNQETNNSLAAVYTYVKEQRQNPDFETVLLDNGDILQGQPVVYYSNFEATDREHICAQVMNFMQYDAATVGNHDIEAGHPVYDKLNKEFNFPWMAANAINTKTGKPYFKPYTILERSGVKIAVLGLITPAIPNWLPENIWSGMEFEDMILTAKKWIKIIKEKEKPDIIIGLFHSGIDYTYDNSTAETYKNENATQLVAKNVNGFDIVFGGHDHQKYNFTVKSPDGSDVLIMDPRSYARCMAVVDIELNWNEEKNTWDKKITGQIIDTDTIVPDKVFMKKFAGFFEETKEYVNQEIGTFTKTIESKDALFGDSEFADLIHTIQLKISKAEISFTAPLSYDSEIKKGKVYVRDMFNLYRFENLLYTMRLSGNEIKKYLEYSANLWFNRMKDENDHLLKLKTTDEGNLHLASAYYNFSSAAGIDYVINLKAPEGERVHILRLSSGKEFDLNKEYLVAINSYRGNGGGGHLIKGAGIPKDKLSERVVHATDKDLRYYMIKWIEEQKSITPLCDNNWTLIPEKWYEKAKAKDMNLLFPED